MRNVIRGIVLGMFALLLAVSAGSLIYGQIQQAQNRQAQEQARDLVEISDPDIPLAEIPVSPVPGPQISDVPEQPASKPIPEPFENPQSEPQFDDEHARELLGRDLGVLQEVNEDIIGWIEIPGTPISYPLLQGTDNQYYLNHNWKKEYNAGGSIFLEAKNRPDLDNFNTLIYGHRMSDSSMFNSLRHYSGQEYADEHSRIYVAAEGGVRVYEVFAAMKVTVTDPVYWLITNQTKYMQKMIDFCMENSVITGGSVPEITDRLLTLSTCTGLTTSDDRWVVVAVELVTITE